MAMKYRLVLPALLCALALPVMAQSSHEPTNLDPEAERAEQRNTRGIEYPALSPEQARANALARCASLPEFYKVDCEARVRGEGEVSGSVLGGGLLRQSVTTLPKEELDRQIESIPRTALPANGN